MKDRDELLHTIQRYDFALYDLMLYLDTHPKCRHAMQLYAKYRKQREEAVKDYVEHYGPLMALQSDTTKKWNWGQGPYPWEKEAN